MTSRSSDMTDDFYLVRNSRKPDTALWISESDIPLNVTDAVFDGRRLGPQKRPYTAHFKANSGKPLDLLTGAVTVPVVSQHLREVVGKFPDPIEFHPVSVQSPKKPSVSYPYFVMNVLESLDAFDWSRSEYESAGDTGIVPMVTRMVLKPAAIGDRHLFRITAYPTVLIISGKGKEILEANQVTGIRYRPVSEFSSIGG